MRVAVIGPTEPDLFACNVARGLRRLGHEAVLVGPARRSPRGRAAAQVTGVLAQSDRGGRLLERATWRRCLSEGVDLVLSLQVDLSPPFVQGLLDRGITTCLWFPDHVTNIGRMFPWLAPYRAVFFKEPLLAHRAREYGGIAAHYLPEACDPELHLPPPGSAPGDVAEVAIVGNMYASRVRLARRLHADGIPLRIYGSAWAPWLQATDLAHLYAGRPVFGAAKAKVFREATAVLNNLHPGEMDGMNCRLFEAAASGGCVVTERRPSLEGLFSEGEHVLAYSSYAELRERLDQARADRAGALARGDAASVHAHAQHSYDVRLRDMLGMVL